MAKECKKCKKSKEDCQCPKKGVKGAYGLEDRSGDSYDDDHQNPDDVQSSGEGMSESLAQQQTRKAAAETRSLEKFKQKAKDAAERQAAKKSLHDKMKSELKNRGIRFSDAKGKGYIKGGKKTYDA